MTDVTADYLALRREVGAVRLDRAVARVAGPDAVEFLQSQLSQDVAALGAGESAWSFVLQPQGKVDAWLRVTRSGDDHLLLDIEAAAEPGLRARLERFKLRSRWDYARLPWRCLALRGPGVEATFVAGAKAELAVPVEWPVRHGPPLAGIDLFGPAVEVPDGVRRCEADAYEAVRIECGVPASGVDIGAGTIPAEAGPWVMERSVSFTKGCYTGQELVARVESRGARVPKPLRGVVIAWNVLPPLGADVVVERDGEPEIVGEITSLGESLERRAPVALARVARRVEPPADATVRWDGGQAPARVEALPLV